MANEAFRMCDVSGIEGFAPPLDGGGGQTMVKHGGGQQPDSGMSVLFVVPGEELLGEGPGILKGTEPFREARPVFKSPELAFRIRVVVRDMRSAVGFGNAKIGHQEGDRFRGH